MGDRRGQHREKKKIKKERRDLASMVFAREKAWF
jgi:hypothetical protein